MKSRWSSPLSASPRAWNVLLARYRNAAPPGPSAGHMMHTDCASRPRPRATEIYSRATVGPKTTNSATKWWKKGGWGWVKQRTVLWMRERRLRTTQKRGNKPQRRHRITPLTNLCSSTSWKWFDPRTHRYSAGRCPGAPCCPSS